MRMLRASSMALGAGLLATPLAHAAPGVSKTTIKIGMFAPETGSASIFGQYAVGARAYYKMINAQGGIHGRKIKVYMENSACTPSKTVAAVRRLVSSDHVFAIHGGVCTADEVAIKPYLARHGVPFMNLGAAGSQVTHPFSYNVFSPLPNTTVVAHTLVNFAMSRPNTKRVAVISEPDNWGKSQLVPAEKLLHKKYHMKFVANVTVEKGETNLSPQILKLRSAKPQVVVTFLYPTPTAIFVKQAYEYGLHSPILGSFAAPYADTIRRVGNPAATKKLYVFAALKASPNSPQEQKWVKMIHKYLGRKAATGGYSLSGIGGAEVMVEALRKAGPNLTRKNFIKALDEIHSYKTHLLAAPITFTKNNQHAGVNSGVMMTNIDGNIRTITAWPTSK